MNILKNIPYTSPADEKRTLDIYLPQNPTGDLFFYIHGGGLEGGDKEEGAPMAGYLMEKGIATASINYRMYPTARYPDFIRDSARALSFVHARKQQYGIRNLYVGGSSAGGYISMMLCFDPQYLAEVNLSNRDIAGYFHDAGQPTCHFRVLAERAIDGRRVIVDDTCPLFHVGTQTEYPPMRFIVSDNDLQNRLEQTMLMLSTLRHFGHKNIDHILMHGDHCQYIGQRDDRGQSILGQMVYRFIQSTKN